MSDNRANASHVLRPTGGNPTRSFAVPGLTASGLSKRYGHRGTWALRDATFEVIAGSISALVGPNGAGKSTLIRLCMGYERPTSGRVTVGGLVPSGDGTGRRGRVGYVAQRPAFHERVSIRDYLELARRYDQRFDVDWAIRQLERLEVPLSRHAVSLSGGQQAHLALVLATGARAGLLLLDEPLASLDPLARRHFLRALLDVVHDVGSTVVLSSHLLADVEGVADHLMVLRDGKIRFDEAVARAIATHRTTIGVPGQDAVGSFEAYDGTLLTLVRRPLAGENLDQRPPTLEEIAMGYLAAHD